MARARLWLKVSGVLVLTAALGAAAALVALKMLFPEPKARAWIVDAARKQLGREVRLAHIHAGLTGLRLRGLEISERPDFAAGTFLSVEIFSLRPSWRALLRRKLVVASASAEGLKLRVVKNTDGSFNYDTLASAAAPEAAAPRRSGENPVPAEFNVRRLRVARGQVDYRDMASGSVWTASDLALKLDDFSLSEPFDLDVSLRAAGKAGGRPVDAALAFAGTVHPAGGSREKFKLEFKRLSAEQDGFKVVAKGRVSGLDAPDAEIDAALSISGKTLLEAAGAARVSAPGAGGGRAVDVDLKLKTPDLNTALIAKWAPGAGVPSLSIPALEAAVVGRWEGSSVQLKTLRVAWPEGKIEGSGSVHKLGSAKPVPDLGVRFAADLPSFRISELPVAVAALPPGFVVPALRLDGGARVRGDDLYLEKASFKGKSGSLRLDGAVRGALAGAPEPALEIQADLDLPALADKDLPFPGAPPGLALPPSRWDADLSYAPRAIRLRKLGLKIGGNEISVEGGVTDPAGRAALDLLFKCRRFVLDELTRLTPRTRELKLSGGGFFALSVTGTKDKPVFGGKLQFKDIGLVVAELPLSGFTGTASFDERRVDVPHLKGKVADGALAMDLTIKDYTKIPEIQIEASLDRFDLGRYLAAKKKLEQDARAAKAVKAAKTGRPAEEKPATPLRARGKLEIGALTHPNAAVEKITASWDLYGVTPDMRKLSGDAKIAVGGGTLHAVGDMAASSPIVKVLIFPILIFQKIGRVGGIRLFPDFNDITVHGIVGDYAFKDGLMTLRRSELDSSAARVSAVGTIDLPAENLNLTVTAQVANVAPIDVAVTGTVANPKTKVALGKFLAAPAQQLLEGLLKR